MTAGSIVAGLPTAAGDDRETADAADDAESVGSEQPSTDEKVARAEARAAAKALRAETKAAAKAARAEAKEAARAERAEAKAAQQEAQSAETATQLEASQDDDATADAQEIKAQAKAARAEAKAKARLDRQAAALARRASREEARAAKSSTAEATTEPDVDVSDHAERPIAVAAQLQRDRAVKEQAAQTTLEADEARQAAKAEAAAAKAAENAARQQEREKAAVAKAKADAAKKKEREEAAAVKAEHKRERDEAKAEAKRQREEAKATQGAAAHRTDSVVEAPRAPKKSLLERLRPAAADSTDGDESTRSTLLPTLAVVLGALGFVFSVILAIGAFMVALNPQDDGGLFNVVSNVCDALVGPLRGVFSFSGVNGESKDALVAWGLGALGYLVLGLFAQSLLRDRSEDS